MKTRLSIDNVFFHLQFEQREEAYEEQIRDLTERLKDVSPIKMSVEVMQIT